MGRGSSGGALDRGPLVLQGEVGAKFLAVVGVSLSPTTAACR